MPDKYAKRIYRTMERLFELIMAKNGWIEKIKKVLTIGRPEFYA